MTVSRSIVVQAAKGFGSAKAAPRPQKPQEAPDMCGCGSGKGYKKCCGPFHTGPQVADTLEATLRARFSAYQKGQADYLLGTTHPDYHVFHYQVPTPGGAEQRLKEDIAQACNKFMFTGLRIVAQEPGSNEREAYISFEYLSRRKGNVTEAEVADMSKWDRTAEKCRFVQVSDGRWQFVDYQRATFDAGMMSGTQAEAAPAPPS